MNKITYLTITVIMALLIIKINAQTPGIFINGQYAASTDFSKFPLWLNEGATLNKGYKTIYISVLQYNIAPASTGGNSLQFENVLLVNSFQTVPPGKAWKVESVIFDSTAINNNTNISGDNWGGQVAQTDQTMQGNGTGTYPLGLAQQGATPGQVLQWDGSAWVAADASAHTDVTLKGDGTTANPFGLAQNNASIGQVLQWNGCEWVPSYVGGGSSNMVFTVSANKSSVTTGTGFHNILSDPLTLTINRVSGNSFPVSIDHSSLPAGVVCIISPGGGYPTISSKISFYTNKSTVTGTYPITFSVSDGTTSQNVNIDLNIITAKRVFVTNDAWTGNLGGLAGADAKCKAEANNTANYIAWLSTSSVDAINRIPDAMYYKDSINYIAMNKSDLTDGNINSPINLNFNGVTPASTETHTGTYATGLKTTSHCNNWTYGSTGTTYTGMAGRGYQKDSQWTETTNGWGCSSNFRLYCFEP